MYYIGTPFSDTIKPPDQQSNAILKLENTAIVALRWYPYIFESDEEWISGHFIHVLAQINLLSSGLLFLRSR